MDVTLQFLPIHNIILFGSSETLDNCVAAVQVFFALDSGLFFYCQDDSL